MLVSQIRDMIEVKVRKHGMKLSRAQATQHQAPEKHPGCKGWACILQREKGGRQTHPTCTDMLLICKHSPSQTARLPEQVKAVHLKRLTVTCMLRQPCRDKGLGRGRTHPCGNAKAHIWLSQSLQLPKLSSQTNPAILPFLCFLSLTEIGKSHIMTPAQLLHFLWHDLQSNTIMAT